MSVETERKFLVNGEFKSLAQKSVRIVQGYLSSAPERSVRIRIRGQQAFLTVKGKSNDSGTTRFEWEKEITVSEAEALLKICEPGLIEKTRYIIPANDNLFFEVDEFYKENQGLILAEIELPDENFPFSKPSWLGKEVTGDNRYYNAYLSNHPFSGWKES